MLQPIQQLQQLRQITIVGTGLLGGSLGLGLRGLGYRGRIVGVARSESTRTAAVARGCVDAATADLAPVLPETQLLVLCAPIGAFPDILATVSRHGHDDLVLTDAGSTKRQVVATAAQCLSPSQFSRFIPAHPMAGSDRHGPDAARADLFEGKPCILTPHADADPGALDLVTSLWGGLGMRLITMDAAEHDRKCAAASHWPHVAAALLVENARAMGGLEVASTGFRDATRIASGHPGLWTDILDSNRDEVLQVIDAYTDQLQHVRRLLEQQDRQGLHDLLTAAKSTRDAWVQRQGSQT